MVSSPRRDDRPVLLDVALAPYGLPQGLHLDVTGGSTMRLDPASVGARTESWRSTWDDRDSLLYALGVGAGVDEAAFTTENSYGVAQRVLPTFGVVVCPPTGALDLVGEVDWGRLLHGGQAVRLHRPLPPAGEGVSTRVSGVHDKGAARHAIVELTTTGTDPADGTTVVETTSTIMLRGAGGFGGERGAPAPPVRLPDATPDVVVEQLTRPEQALLYRLSGDRNPLHSDPWFATEKAGFPRPILHGLCTYGFAGRALLHALCGGDPARFRAMAPRFSAPVFPGETLITSMWRAGAGRAVFRTEAAGPGSADRRTVLDGGTLEHA
jgi:acyl dehydratase